MSNKLTTKDQWFLHYLRYTAPKGEFISPGLLGAEYYKETKKGSGHSSSASPTLLKLTSLCLVERNSKGHYRDNQLKEQLEAVGV